MMNTIEFKEFSSYAHIEACIQLQETIFELPDLHKLPPMLLNLLTRKNPQIGIAIGAFDTATIPETMRGYLLSIATSERGAHYGLMVGVVPEQGNRHLGFGLINIFRKIALSYNIIHFYGVYDPLEGNLANLYLNRVGFTVLSYEPNPFEHITNLSQKLNIPNDRALFHWEMNSTRTQSKLSETYNKPNWQEIHSNTSIATLSHMPDAPRVLIEIPGDFITLSKQAPTEALQWRLSTRALFSEYLNHRGYSATEFYSERGETGRKNFYLLEKPQGQ